MRASTEIERSRRQNVPGDRTSRETERSGRAERKEDMNLRNLLLASMTSNKAVKEVAVKTGLPEKYVRKLMKLAIPVILKHLTKNVSTSAGLIALAAALKHHTNKKEMEKQLKEADEKDGHKIIHHIFGRQEKEVTQELCAQSGLTVDQVNQILAIMAPALMSGVSEAAANTTTVQESHKPTISLDSASGIFGALTGSKPSQEEEEKENSSSTGMALLQALLSAGK